MSHLQTHSIIKSRDRVKIVCTAYAMVIKVDSYAIQSMIRRNHVYRDVWSSFIAEVLMHMYAATTTILLLL